MGASGGGWGEWGWVSENFLNKVSEISWNFLRNIPEISRNRGCFRGVQSDTYCAMTKKNKILMHGLHQNDPTIILVPDSPLEYLSKKM